MDLVVRVSRFPENGETIMGRGYSRFPGGKGANQAVSAARLNGNVIMAGKVGKDDYGNEALEVLSHEGINTDNILSDDKVSTGVGFVTLEDNGDNRIIVIPGANLTYQIGDLQKIRNIIYRSEILVLQLEMTLSVIEQAIKYAYEDQVPVILNPAPAQKLGDELLSKVDYLTPNETEAELLTGIKINSMNDAKDAGYRLLEKGVKNVVITLGEHGSLIVNNQGSHHVSGFTVKPADTVAAGDAFNGALAVGITEGKKIVEAVKYANAVGALTVTRPGAIPSLPTAQEVRDYMMKTAER